MPKEKEEKRVKRWFKRLGDANKAYERWAKDFKVARCKRYWKGFQRISDDTTDKKGAERVQINLILPTVAIRIPSLYYYYPYARIVGSPGRSATPGEYLDDRAQLLQDMANTIIREPSSGFRWETLLALKDAFWAFGVVEIGYSAEFADNPAFKRPPLAEEEDVKEDMGPAPKDEPGPSIADDPQLASLRKVVQDETFFVRRIPPETFRCSINSKPTFLQNDWIGYYEWMYVEDVKQAPAYKGNTSGLKPSGKLAGEPNLGSAGSSAYTAGYGPETGEQFANEDTYETRDRSGMIQVWKIWSLREKMRYVLAEGHDQFLLTAPYRVLPLFTLRFEEQPDDFYPIPPISQMLIPQDEYNDGREMLRGLRKTIYPRYLVRDGGIEPQELTKLEEGGPNTYAFAADPAAVQPIQQPSWDASVVRTLVVAKDDLLQVSGVPGEQRGQAESDTATQAMIVNQRSLARESFGRLRVAEWLSGIISGLLRLAIERMTLPMWILKNADPFSQQLVAEAIRISQLYKQITYTELKEADNLLRWDIEVDVETLSPLTEQTARAEMGQMLQMISTPPVAALLSRSRALLKKVLDTFGFRSASDQQAIGEALGVVAAMSQQGMGGAPSPPGAGGPNAGSPAPGPGPGGGPAAPQPAGPISAAVPPPPTMPPPGGPPAPLPM